MVGVADKSPGSPGEANERLSVEGKAEAIGREPEFRPPKGAPGTLSKAAGGSAKDPAEGPLREGEADLLGEDEV
jgi:hypothetical protein